jgi:hypothetical protein
MEGVYLLPFSLLNISGITPLIQYSSIIMLAAYLSVTGAMAEIHQSLLLAR